MVLSRSSVLEPRKVCNTTLMMYELNIHQSVNPEPTYILPAYQITASGHGEITTKQKIFYGSIYQNMSKSFVVKIFIFPRKTSLLRTSTHKNTKYKHF